MIYNFNQGIGWASSGVEFAQSYRAAVFRTLKEEAKFIFTDEMPKENIEHMTANMGFTDNQIMWLYQSFTDCKIAPASYTLADLEKTLGDRTFSIKMFDRKVQYVFEKNDCFYTAYLIGKDNEFVHRVEIVQDGKLIRKDFFTYCRIYSEFYAPLNNKAHLYQRRFYNEDGTTAYEEILDPSVGDRILYVFPDRILDSKQDLVGYFFERLCLTEDDIVIIDRNEKFGQAILRNIGRAKVGVVIHAEHFSEPNTGENNILWNNFYEYAFGMHKHIDFYITATEEQKKLLEKQFRKYKKAKVRVFAIPVGALPKLSYPEAPRKPFSLITASRLATEKHIDLLIDATADVHEMIPEITLDICGEGSQRKALSMQIEKRGAQDYIHLLGQQKLDDMYKKYEAYVSGSTSEGFGLTLMEAVGSGLPIIGFDVRYGNPTFIRHAQNGYLIPLDGEVSYTESVDRIKECILRLFQEADLVQFHENAYAVAEKYQQTEVEQRWKRALRTIRKL